MFQGATQETRDLNGVEYMRELENSATGNETPITSKPTGKLEHGADIAAIEQEIRYLTSLITMWKNPRQVQQRAQGSDGNETTYDQFREEPIWLRESRLIEEFKVDMLSELHGYMREHPRKGRLWN